MKQPLLYLSSSNVAGGSSPWLVSDIAVASNTDTTAQLSVDVDTPLFVTNVGITVFIFVSLSCIMIFGNEDGKL